MYGKLFTVDFSSVVAIPGNISVAMVTDSPGLTYYELNHNGKRVTTRENHFNWELNDGRNILEMRTVDIHGNKGLKSKLVLNYLPK